MEHAAVRAISYCPDCGPAAVPHWAERLGVRIDIVTGWLMKPAEVVWRWIKPGVATLRLGRLAPPLARGFAALHLSTIIDAPDEKLNWRSRVLWKEAARRGIVMKEFRPFGISRELFFATYRNDTVAFDGLPRPRGADEATLDWMDDKGVIIKKFAEAGIPAPRGRACRTFAQAEQAFASIHGSPEHPVIVKPNLGSRSRHTYIHITGLAALEHAFKKAKELSPYAVVEEELKGFVFRITLVDGKVAGIMRREPPHVMGDGKRTVQKLVEEENKNPLRHGPIFHELSLGEEAQAELRKQNLTPDTIPAKGVMVVLHDKVSRAYGASTTEIAPRDVHPDNLALFKKIADVLHDPLVGVDFMIEDLSRSWRTQTCGIIECNSLPFIDLHHFPLRGDAVNVAGKVWDMIFPLSGTGTAPARQHAFTRE